MAAWSLTTLSPANPSMTLHRWHRRPRIWPVLWSWSTPRRLRGEGVARQMAHRPPCRLKRASHSAGVILNLLRKRSRRLAIVSAAGWSLRHVRWLMAWAMARFLRSDSCLVGRPGLRGRKNSHRARASRSCAWRTCPLVSMVRSIPWHVAGVNGREGGRDGIIVFQGIIIPCREVTCLQGVRAMAPPQNNSLYARGIGRDKKPGKNTHETTLSLVPWW